MDLYYWAAGILVVLNIITFIVFGVDKHAKKNGGERIPEVTMFMLGMFGGALGAFLGMHYFRNKIHTGQFYLGMPAFLLLHVIIAFIVLSFTL